MSIVSDNMKYLRKLHGMTQEQFARRVGIKRASVGAYEEQRANPNLDVLKTMSRLFNVSVDDLLKKDLRKIRETPSLLPIDKPTEIKVETNEPKALSSIFEQFYTPPTTTPKVSEPTGNLPKPTPVPPAITAPKPPEPVYAPPPVPTYTPPVVTVPIAPSAPTFNNIHDTPNGVSMVQAPPTPGTSQPLLVSIQYVRQTQLKEYIERFHQTEYLKRLPVFQAPMLPEGQYRAFEAGDDFLYAGSLLIGQFVANWYDISDGKMYVLVARNLGVVCRRVYNQVKIKGTLLLSSDKNTIPTFEIPLKDVLEVWEIKAFMSTILPEPPVPLEHLRHLVQQMQEELNRIKK
ncbi:MAG: helix-turn-helix domain-containing protein [Runella sp.]